MGDRDNAAFDDIELPAGVYIDRQEYLPGLYLDEGYTDLGVLRFNNARGETADSKTHWAQYEKSRWPEQPRLQPQLQFQPPSRPPSRPQQKRACAQQQWRQPLQQPQPQPQQPHPHRRTREGFVGYRELYGNRTAIEAARAVIEGIPAGYDPSSGPDNRARLVPGQSVDCVVPSDCTGGYPVREDWPVESKSWAKKEPWNAGPPTGVALHTKSGFESGSASGFASGSASGSTLDSGLLMQMLQTLLLFILVILMAVKLGFSIARHAADAPVAASRYEMAVK
jgi:hypothetical protein